MHIAGLGDATSFAALSAGVFPRHGPAAPRRTVSSELGKLFEQFRVKPRVKGKQSFLAHEEIIRIWLVGVSGNSAVIDLKYTEDIFSLLLVTVTTYLPECLGLPGRN